MIRLLHVYYPRRTVALLLSEAILTAGCFVAAAFLLAGSGALLLLSHESALQKILAITLFSIFLSYYCDLYEPQTVSAHEAIYVRILIVLGFDCVVVMLLRYFYPTPNISIFADGVAILTPVLFLWRHAHKRLLTVSFLQERVYVLGSGKSARSIVTTIGARPELGMQVIDWEEIDGEDLAERKQSWSTALEQIGRSRRPVHRVIVALERHRGELPVEELLKLRLKGIVVEDVRALRERLYGKIELDGLLPSSLLYAEGFRLKAKQHVIRRGLAILAAAAGLVLFLPLLPFVALAVKLSSEGPVLFRQTRVGVGEKTFQLLKFRTMYVDAEAAGPRWASANDPRITWVGSILRKTHIDEIPQLWNVLCGDMGFVGPRPERPEFLPMLVEALPFYYMRHLVRPGLTGWAQVRYGYAATLGETREKLEYDLYYIKHMSFGLDTLILFETIKTILRRRGAR